jgi:hypothetical protein
MQMSKRIQKLVVPNEKPSKVSGSPTFKETLSMKKTASLTARPIAGTSGERFPAHIIKQSNFPGYRDPLPDLGDFLYKRLYSDAPEMFYSPQVSPRVKEYRSTETSNSFYGQGVMKRDVSMPIYTNLPGDPAFSKTRQLVIKGDTTPKTLNARGLEQERTEQPLRSPQNIKNVREIPQYVENILSSPKNRKVTPQNDQYLPNIRENISYIQTLPEERTREAPKIIYRKPNNPNSPTLKDTSKMRNPIFSDYDFSKYDSNTPKSRYIPESYNYADAEPVSPTAYTKSHIGYITKASTQDFPVQYEPQRQEYETMKYASPKGNAGLNLRSEPNPTNYNMSYKAPKDISYSPMKPTGMFKEDKVIQKSNHYIPFENVKRGIPAAQGEFAWRAEVQKLSLASSTGNGYEQRYAYN